MGNKTKVFLCLMFFLGFASSAKADTQWYVHNYIDAEAEGTLRTVLQTACELPGDDNITFMTPIAPGPLHITLLTPLVIPRTCRGRIHLTGLDSHETKLEINDSVGDVYSPGSGCILNVYSDGNDVEKLKFFGNSTGSAICLFGRGNNIHNNVFGENVPGFYVQNYYGVLTSDFFASRDVGMDGAQNTIRQNTFLTGGGVGIYAHSANNLIQENQLFGQQQAAIIYIGSQARILDNDISDSGEMALLVQGATGTVRDNQLLRSRLRGLIYEGTNGTLINNTITGTGQEALLYRGDDANITLNTITNAGTEGAALEGNNITFTSNPITTTGSNGIVGKISRSRITDNVIHDLRRNGMLLATSDVDISGNEVYEAKEEGIVLEGSGGKVFNNNIHSNAGSGFSLSGAGFWLFKNKILANGGCPTKQKAFASQKVPCFAVPNGNGTGILIDGNSKDIVIGGEDFDRHANEILYNHDGGVVLRGTSESIRNKITHNIISNNYGGEPDVDLKADGVTDNDEGDSDGGPNGLLNKADYLQAFLLVPNPEGEARYWSWGVAKSGAQVELYRLSDEDVSRRRDHGGAAIFFADGDVIGRTFRILPPVNFNSFEDQKITLLTHDAENNTSEFSKNTDAGRDQDYDGIIDSLEVRSGDGSRMDLTDTDGDGLPDSVEDRNRNGVWDRSQGETCAYLADSDGDGLNDWAETHGDGIYDVGVDTDPFDRDTDHDGLLDGQEDRNNNGVWDNDQGETSPFLSDSDSDGFPDFRDTCPHIPNPTQESWMCILPSS